MFFILSKLLMFLFKPINWIVIAFLSAIWLKTPWARKVAFYTGLTMLLLFTNPLLSQLAWNAWEPKPVKFEDLEGNFEAVIIPGGYTHAVKEPRDRVHFNKAYDRLARGVELYKKGKANKILLTSGSAQLVGEKVKASLIVEDHLSKWGIPEDDILVEGKSRNTHENAVFSAKKLRNNFQGGDYILVTSASHMYRAKRCFAKEGIQVTTFPADFRSGRIKWELDNLLLPNAGALRGWEILIKEWLGIAAYWVFGYL